MDGLRFSWFRPDFVAVGQTLATISGFMASLCLSKRGSTLRQRQPLG